MKNRYLFPVILALILVLSLAISAFAPMGAEVEVPAELIEMINFVALIAFTALARWVASKLGFDIQDRAAEIATAVAAVVVVALNHYIDLMPVEYESWLEAIFAFLTVLFGGNGVYGLFLREKVRG